MFRRSSLLLPLRLFQINNLFRSPQLHLNPYEFIDVFYVNKREKASQAAAKSKNKTFGLFNTNVKQLLKLIHPDTFRSAIKGETDYERIEYFSRLSSINQKSLQSLNSFASTMGDYKSNLQMFVTASESLKLEFYVITPNSYHAACIKSELRFPNINAQVWVQHSDPSLHMSHWRDIQLLQFLHTAHQEIGSKLNVSFLPSDSDVSFLRDISKKTMIPLPSPYNIKFGIDTMLRAGEQLDPNQRFKDVEERKKAEKPILKTNENGNDFYDALRWYSLRESSHPRNPNHPTNKKYGIKYFEPSLSQLKSMLKVMQIDFAPGTDPSVMKGCYQYLINNAKKLNIHQWYHYPIMIGTPEYQILDHTVIGLPYNFDTKDLNAFFDKRMNRIKRNNEIFRNKMKGIAEKMMKVRETFNLINISNDPLIHHEKLDQYFDKLLGWRKLISQHNLNLLKLHIHEKDHFYYGFDNSSGTIFLPLSTTEELLENFLETCTINQEFANYRVARVTIPHLKAILMASNNIASLKIPASILQDCLLTQQILFNLVTYISEYAPHNTFERLNIVVSPETNKIESQPSLLVLPPTFTSEDLAEYVTERFKIEHRRPALLDTIKQARLEIKSEINKDRVK